MSVRLREMTWRDIPALAALDQQLFAHDAWREPVWWAELAARPRREYVVARPSEPGREPGAQDADVPLGYAGLDVAGETADVMTIATAPEAQGRGIGDTLLTHLETRARARGAERLLLEVRADNDPAQRLYARHGFAQVHVRRRYYQPGGVDALILSKELA